MINVRDNGYISDILCQTHLFILVNKYICASYRAEYTFFLCNYGTIFAKVDAGVRAYAPSVPIQPIS